jgi:hypothetical protein
MRKKQMKNSPDRGIPRFRAATKWAGVLLAAAIAAPAAFGELERVGPTDPRYGFPAWYQDTTGLALELAVPLTQSELNGGWTLLLPGDTTVPETFPNTFADEHFWWAGDAVFDYTLPNGGTSRAILVLGLEAAFGIGPVVAGDQVVFGRVRIRLNDIPYTGTYRVYTPFGVWDLDAVAGDRLFFTEDIGIAAPPGDFSAALSSHVGPFLLPSATPGGPEIPPVTAANPTPDTDPAHFGGVFAPTPYPGTGKAYIADPSRDGPVTGSPLPPFRGRDDVVRNHNIFRVEGPNGFEFETYNFTLMGRIYTGVIPGIVQVQRASYTDTGAPGGRWLDVFATGEPTSGARLPAQPRPAPILPVVTFYPAPPPADPVTGESIIPLSAPAGVAEVQMLNDGNRFWGQVPISTIPTAVTVKDGNARNAAGQVVPVYYERSVTDAIQISDASYSPINGGTLTIKAKSTDQLNKPLLSCLYGDLLNDQIIVSPLLAPPARITIVSAASGVNSMEVTTAFGLPNQVSPPVAVNDAFTVLEDSDVTAFDILDNDTHGSPVTVTIVSDPTLGTATIDPNTGEIEYQPNPDANGTDSFTYRVTSGGFTSNDGLVTITITPVNDVPVAVNDTALTVARFNTTLDVLANDTDVDGHADLVAPTAVSRVTTLSGGRSTATVVPGPNGELVFNATGAGSYRFTYEAQDSAGAVSNPATVIVNVLASEVITVVAADFNVTQLRWTAVGTDNLVAGQILTVSYANGTMRDAQVVNGVSTTSAAGHVLGTATVDATGAWNFVANIGATGIDNPTNTGNTTPIGTFWITAPTSIRITSPFTGTVTAPFVLD